jgi:hypothetical protein
MKSDAATDDKFIPARAFFISLTRTVNSRQHGGSRSYSFLLLTNRSDAWLANVVVGDADRRVLNSSEANRHGGSSARCLDVDRCVNVVQYIWISERAVRRINDDDDDEDNDSCRCVPISSLHSRSCRDVRTDQLRWVRHFFLNLASVILTLLLTPK